MPGMAARKSTSSSKFWRWRTRSNKSTMSEADAALYASPTESPVVSTLPKQQCPAPLASPFLTESAHVLSLQHPSPHRDVVPRGDHHTSDCPDTKSDCPSSPDTVVHIPPSSGSVARQFLNRAKKGLEYKLGRRPPKEVIIHHECDADPGS